MHSKRVRIHDEDNWPLVAPGGGLDPLRVPPFATRKLARERALRIRQGTLHTVRMFPDHGRDWPLWDERCGYTVAPDAYGLSFELIRGLCEWATSWNRFFDINAGWPSARVEEEWRAEGVRLAEELAIAVWPFGDVYLELGD